MELLKEINARLTELDPIQKAIMEIDGKTDLSADEQDVVDRLVQDIKSELSQGTESTDSDAVKEKLYMELENIPGLEQMDAQDRVAQAVMSKVLPLLK